jgi:predicted NBD/HSP70 family sugar kinase
MRSLSVPLGRDPKDLEECLLLASEQYAPAVAVFEEACYALGVVVAHVVNLLGPDLVILSGEGIEMYNVAPSAVRAGVLHQMHADASSFETVVESFAFPEWARGAAVTAIQSLIYPDMVG